MAADARHRLGLDLGQLAQQRHGRHQIVGAQPHLHGAARVGPRGDGAAQRQDMDARLAHAPNLNDLKKRSTSGVRSASAGPRQASDT